MKPAYRSLALQTIVSGIIMYMVMFVMIDRLSSFYNNLNMLYMTLMMVAPMVVLMIVAMPGMFPSKRLNTVLLLGSVVAFLGSFALIRTQTTIGDTAFLRSMIPHHSGAILMCEQASLKDAEIRRLCSDIIAGQAAEIEQMKSILARKCHEKSDHPAPSFWLGCGRVGDDACGLQFFLAANGSGREEWQRAHAGRQCDEKQADARLSRSRMRMLRSVGGYRTQSRLSGDRREPRGHGCGQGATWRA